jgi:hypothetical protein
VPGDRLEHDHRTTAGRRLQPVVPTTSDENAQAPVVLSAVGQFLAATRPTSLIDSDGRPQPAVVGTPPESTMSLYDMNYQTTASRNLR